MIELSNPSPTLLRLFENWIAKTDGDVSAAAMLVLAQVNLNAANTGDKQELTPPQIAQRLHVRRSTVMGWIASQQLPATNVSKGVRPRWIVQAKDLERFLDSRQPDPVAQRTIRMPSRPDDRYRAA